MAGAAVGPPPSKRRAAALSIASNSALILLKVVAGAITGSVALIAEAVQSSLDLVASVVAYVSVRKADEPADDDHPYGHEKIENLAAGVEGVLILVGSAIIVFEAVRRLVTGGEVQQLRIGIAILALTIVVNVVVSARIARRARETDSPALEGDAAHLRADALTSTGVLAGLVLVQITGAEWVDAAAALLVAAVIIATGVRLVSRATRVLVDEALPPEELESIREAVVAFGARDVVGFHKLRARHAGARHLVDMHVQFRSGTTLEEAHQTAHALQDAIGERLPNSEVLIHLEPEDSLRPGTGISAG